MSDNIKCEVCDKQEYINDLEEYYRNLVIENVKDKDKIDKLEAKLAECEAELGFYASTGTYSQYEPTWK